MNRLGKPAAVAVAALSTCTAATAQDNGLSVSVGARAWYMEWTTFSYVVDENGDNVALSQVSANEKFVLVPLLSLRYGRFLASASMVPSTRFHFVDGGSGERREWDLNLGYAVLPGLNLSLGYKSVSQRDGDVRYEPAGPVFGISGSAPLSGGFSLYGSFGAGRLKTPQSGGDDVVKFKTSYRLTELGVAYALAGAQVWPRWTLTAGYRIQVMSSKEAFGSQDGRDTTQGLSFGAVASF